MRIRNYFKGAVVARMSDGSYCLIRDLGLVKGGKGLRHHENLLRLSVGGVVSRFAEIVRSIPRRATSRRSDYRELPEGSLVRASGARKR